jgi:hypothetical protein
MSTSPISLSDEILTSIIQLTRPLEPIASPDYARRMRIQ